MIKFNKYCICLFILLYFCSNNDSYFAFAQQRLFTKPNNSQKSNEKPNINQPATNTSSNKNETQPSTSNNTTNTTNTSNTSNTTNTSNNTTQSISIKTFDPFLDNHLKAPPDGITVGKFGKSIKQVEEELRLLGAKNHSYAFGKYSKMVFSSYLITLNFDVNKRLGKVDVVPKYPLKTIEQKAQEFFIKLFTEGADMTQVGIILSSNKLELRFISPD